MSAISPVPTIGTNHLLCTEHIQNLQLESQRGFWPDPLCPGGSSKERIMAGMAWEGLGDYSTIGRDLQLS